MNVTLKISGMSCGHCEKAVLGALKAVEGVESVQVNLKEGNAHISGQNLNVEPLIAAVQHEGYQASL
ncbi:MAG: cation transporter [Deinococcaceae bacterium]